MVWWLRDPTRFLHEFKAFEQLDAEADWLGGIAWRTTSGFGIEVDFDIKAHGKRYAATLTYPDLFPETPAYIRPRELSEQWSNHQYGPGGSLCLEWRADNWERNVRGIDLVTSAYHLLTTEQNPELPVNVPSAHQITDGQGLRTQSQRMFCTSEMLAVLSSLPAPITLRIRTASILHQSTMVTFVSQIEDTHGSMDNIADLPSGLTSSFPLFSWARDGQLFKSDLISAQTAINSVAELVELIRITGYTEESILVQDTGSAKCQDRIVLLVGAEPRSLRAFAIKAGDTPTFCEYKVILPEESSQRLPTEYAKLAELKFGIVGLGSMGSKIAVSLARSGGRKFVLIDDDFLVPGNLTRHELSWSAVGVHKAEALKEELSLIASGIEIMVHCHRIAGQESAVAEASILKELSKCDVLIDATANPEVFVRLGAIAKISSRPLFWGELFAGGFGGMIARARPEKDPNPLAVRGAISSYLDTLPPAPFKNVDGYDIDRPQPLIAFDSEISQIASILTRFIIDGALQCDPSEFPYSAYLIGLQKKWIFTQPFDTYPIDVSGPGWRSDVDSAVLENNRNEALQLLLNLLDNTRADTDPQS